MKVTKFLRRKKLNVIDNIKYGSFKIQSKKISTMAVLIGLVILLEAGGIYASAKNVAVENTGNNEIQVEKITCNVNNYSGLNDNEKIEAAIKDCKDGVVVIPERKSDIEPERTYWLLDRAILIPENTTVILRNCKIKLSDKCRDNFFRSANCGLGIEDPQPISNIHIKGEGLCILEGADHPRSTGDGSKVLKNPCPKTKDDILKYADWLSEEKRQSGELDFMDEHGYSYGTDAGKENESQYGDWRNVGILFANATNCSIENIKIVRSHAWAISWEACSQGYIDNIEFDSCMSAEIDGMLSNTENQDGIDLRNGCHDITISNITGGTGDDVIALTAICDDEYYPGGSMEHTQVMHNDWTRREKNIYNINISNISAYSKGGACWIVRLLPTNSNIYNVVIDNVIDTSPEGFEAGGVILLGEEDGSYGKNLPGSLKNIIISNIIGSNNTTITLKGYLEDSLISNVINKNKNCPVIDIYRRGGLKNVEVIGIETHGVVKEYGYIDVLPLVVTGVLVIGVTAIVTVYVIKRRKRYDVK